MEACVAPSPLEFLELTRIDEPLLLPWLDLCELAFPPNERMLVSYHLNLLADCQNIIVVWRQR